MQKFFKTFFIFSYLIFFSNISNATITCCLSQINNQMGQPLTLRLNSDQETGLIVPKTTLTILHKKIQIPKQETHHVLELLIVLPKTTFRITDLCYNAHPIPNIKTKAMLEITFFSNQESVCKYSKPLEEIIRFLASRSFNLEMDFMLTINAFGGVSLKLIETLENSTRIKSL